MKNKQSTLMKMMHAVPFAAVVVLITIGSVSGADVIGVPSITPLFENSREVQQPVPGERRGFIERIEADRRVLVISDATKRLAPDARFYRKYNGTPIFLSEFQVGTFIGYTVNDQAEIDVMWIAENTPVSQLP